MNDIPEEEEADSGRVRSGRKGIDPVVGRRIVGIDISRVEDCSAISNANRNIHVRKAVSSNELFCK